MDDSRQRRTKIFQARLVKDVDYLVGALREPEYRPLAAQFLGSLRADSAAPAIMSLLDASDASARRAAIEALGRLRWELARPQLRDIVREDPDEYNRLCALVALAAIGGDAALDDLAPYLRHSRWNFRRAAAFSLGVLGDERAIELLRRAKATERWTRRRPYRVAIQTIRRRRCESTAAG